MNTPAGGRKTREQRRREAESRDALNRLKKPIIEKIRHCESLIEKLESRKQELETRMADPATYQQNNQVRELQYQHAEIERDLQACYKEWEGLQETLDQLANKNQTEL